MQTHAGYSSSDSFAIKCFLEGSYKSPFYFCYQYIHKKVTPPRKFNLIIFKESMA